LNASITSAVMRLSSQISPSWTLRMLFSRRSLADCFSTTPRAPRRIVPINISRSSSAAVRTMTRVGRESKIDFFENAEAVLLWHAHVEQQDIGFELGEHSTHWLPFAASPTTPQSFPNSSLDRTPKPLMTLKDSGRNQPSLPSSICRRTKISAQLISIGNRLPSRSDEASLVVPQTASTYPRHALSDGLPMTCRMPPK
jgi:hypothetical protein